MGWFQDIFKKKKGGTFMGNLIRGVGSSLTGGLVGSGKNLAEWQAKQEQKEYQTEFQRLQRELSNNPAYRTGQGIAKNSGAADKVNHAMYESEEAQQFQKDSAMAFIKRNWWVAALGVLGIGSVAFAVGKRG